jgi:lipid A 3-O-deacylase
MKLKLTILMLFFSTLLSTDLLVVEVNAAETISEERYNKVCRFGPLNPPECKRKVRKSRRSGNERKSIGSSSRTTQTQKKIKDNDCKWGMFNPPKCRGKDSRYKNGTTTDSSKEKQVKKVNSYDRKEKHNISVYTGTFDLIDKEGDDKTNLMGIEHKNKSLFRDTWIGRFSPTTGAFITGKSSVYLYTGIEGDYNLGPINISPSFSPGYYEAGDGKDLGSALEFKSEIKIGVDLFKNSNLGYSYSHISNNDWGDKNPGTDNQSVTFSKKF